MDNEVIVRLATRLSLYYYAYARVSRENAYETVS